MNEPDGIITEALSLENAMHLGQLTSYTFIFSSIFSKVLSAVAWLQTAKLRNVEVTRPEDESINLKKKIKTQNITK